MVDPPIEVTIEIPSGSRNKYEYDHVRNRFVLDRILYSSVVYPCDYGFIERSLADDGDPLDVLIVISERAPVAWSGRGRWVCWTCATTRADYKVLAVAHDDPRWDGTSALGDLSPHLLREIENFFDTYKALEGRETRGQRLATRSTTPGASSTRPWRPACAAPTARAIRPTPAPGDDPGARTLVS